MRRLFFFVAVLSVCMSILSCGSSKDPNSANGDTPTAAYKRLFDAVKSKDLERIKAQLTKRTIEQGQSNAKRWQKSEEAVLEHGMVASTMAEALPEIRDERIKDNMGAIEVWNSHDSVWEDLPFMVEDGQFKLALGELFGGIYKWPGRGRSSLDRQTSNANMPNVNLHPATNNAKPSNAK